MKAVIFFGLFLSLSAFAADGTCPDLRGTYKCDDGKMGFTFEQRVENGVTIYTFTDPDHTAQPDTFAADGKPVVTTRTNVEDTTVSHCENHQLISHLAEKPLSNDAWFVIDDATITYVKDGANVVVTMTAPGMDPQKTTCRPQ